MIEKHAQSAPTTTPTPERESSERLVLLVPQDAPDRDRLDLLQLCRILWEGKWLAAGIILICTVLAMWYALTATEWYRSEVLLAPVDRQNLHGLGIELGSLGGLAGFAGIQLGDDSSVEPIAVLKSRSFARAFIEDEGLMPVLLAEEWDPEAGRWKAEDPADHPDVRDAIKYFDEHIRTVSTDPNTELVTLAIQWIDPTVAAHWARLLVERLNDDMRQRVLAEAEYNVAYLKQELSQTNVASLRQSISNILETELQKLMLAKGNEEFAFRVLDTASIPKKPIRPKRLLIVAFAVMLGGLLSASVVLLRNHFRNLPRK